jgi:hypothetical protein
MVVTTMSVLVNLLICVGMLVIVPIGLGLLDDPSALPARQVWPVGAACGAISLWLPRGAVATSFAMAYALGAAVLCAYAISRPIRLGARRGDRAAASVARVDGRDPRRGERPRIRPLRHGGLAPRRGICVTTERNH